MSSRPQLLHIKSVEARPGYRLVVSWDQRLPQATIDLSDMIERGGVFADLSDTQKFALATIGENNRVVTWPEPKDDMGYPIIEIDAESLLRKYEQQRDQGLVSIMKDTLETFRRVRKAAPLKS